MRTIILTIATPNIVPLCIDFLANQLGYARKNDHEYKLVTDIHWPTMHPSFSKVWEIHQALQEGYDRVIWMDADVAIMDYRVNLGALVDGEYFMAAYHQANWKAWVYLCAGLTVWRNCEESKAFVDLWMDRVNLGSPVVVAGTRTIIEHKPWEQWYMDELVRETNWKGLRACTAEQIGCFCPEVWHDGTLWKPGMPTIHMAGDCEWSKRSEIFRTIYEKQVIRC